jgi:hypothetical protein
MADSERSTHRKRLGVSEIERAQRILHFAWLSLPTAHRVLLESIGASQSQGVDQPLGGAADSFLHSAGHRGLSIATRRKLNLALGAWLQELRIILIDIGHPKLVGLDQATYEAFIMRTAWHELGARSERGTLLTRGRGGRKGAPQPCSNRSTREHPTSRLPFERLYARACR